jgi:acyl-[acyl-carrier-protein]-phospholipid O-acyltransferase/long-chain-fatty-acid--[acyl-carrier-protein] ligase
VDSIRTVLHATDHDDLCAALPLFHSMGFTATVWLPLTVGFAATYHPNPVDGAAIAERVREERCTILVATPTFLLAYIRRATREDFASLRLVITGAEKLKAKVAEMFEKKFGIRPMEGYGTTELSPVAALNLPDRELDGYTQVGHKPGTVGHPIAHVAARIVDEETAAPRPPGQPGLLLIKGPNVMRGYLNAAERTAEVMSDGWYNTGDVAMLDEDGFLTITDRLSRFSKIGGEMVPHGALEEILVESLPTTELCVAVTAAPDEKKGERIVVLHTEEAGEADNLQRILTEADIPNLWKPRRENFIKVDEIPVLGTGKLDLKRLRELAQQEPST